MEVLCQKGVLQYFAKFTGKHLYQSFSPVSIKSQNRGLQLSLNKDFGTGVFIAENWTKNINFKCNFGHNLKGFQSKGNIFAQNIFRIFRRVLFVIYSFRLRTPIIFSDQSLLLEIFSRIFLRKWKFVFQILQRNFGYYFKKKMKGGF